LDKLRISTKDIIFAWLDDSRDNSYYLDKIEGETRMVNRNLIELRDLTDEIERRSTRYLYVPKLTKEDLIEDLNSFLETVERPDLKNVLPIAFESPHKVSAFRKILEKAPDELQRFDDFREKQILRRVEKWLNANGIEPSFK
jgi:citrate lyase beta subunit